jgi:hypothetical protein
MNSSEEVITWRFIVGNGAICRQSIVRICKKIVLS